LRWPHTQAAPARTGYIGKETDRRWEQGDDISIVDSEVIEYTPNETARLVADIELLDEARRFSIRALAKAAAFARKYPQNRSAR
jgi:hypothetical protein